LEAGADPNYPDEVSIYILPPSFHATFDILFKYITYSKVIA
jgi:hypothetical protein